MPAHGFDQSLAHLANPRRFETLDVFGPVIEVLLSAETSDDALCILRGTIPPGGCIPLHSHADRETFLPISGEFEALATTGDRFDWVELAAGDVFDVPGGVKHAFRNRSTRPAVTLVVTTAKIGRFFREIGRTIPFDGRQLPPPTARQIGHFIETTRLYGYWNATPAENAKAGLLLPSAP